MVGLPLDRGTHASYHPFEQSSLKISALLGSTATSAVDVTDLKRQRIYTRRQITAACKQASRAVLGRGSRGGIQALMLMAETALETAEQLEIQLTEEPDADQEAEHHAFYVELIGKVAEEVDLYLLDRADEQASAIVQPAGRPAHAVSPPEGEQQRFADVEGLTPLQQNNAVGTNERPAPDGERRLTTDNETTRTTPWQFVPLCSRPEQIGKSFTTPDEWIDLYVSGQLAPYCRGDDEDPDDSLQTDLTPFSGRALEWFGWIELFRALVHDTGMAPAEKLAVLKLSLPREFRDSIYSFGSGEEAYKATLSHLKQNYGRRDVIRAANRLALDQLELDGSDLISYQRFANRVTSHLFDLNRAGDPAILDIVEKLCLKLPPPDRAAWNEGTRGGSDSCTLHQFGSWLRHRAAAYQTSYSIAEGQLSPGSRKKPPWSDRN